MSTTLARRRVTRLPDGRVISRADLPPPETRWTATRRALMVELVLHDIITAPELRCRYQISRAEFARWCQNYATNGDTP